MTREKMAKTKEQYLNFGSTQKEALINEYKGNLFEYIVAHQCARQLGLEERFLSDFGGEAKQRLSTYESWLRENDRELIQALPKLAGPVAESLAQQLRPLAPSALLVVGKSAASQSAQDRSLKEADLLALLGPKSEHEQGISLKLCKANAFVNTKSGGLKSFFRTYFAKCADVAQAQAKLHKEVDRVFWKMGHELYEAQGLGEFTGHFDQRWTEAGLSELPGELPEEYKRLVQSSYQKLIQQLHSGFLMFQKNDPKAFNRSLEALMGFGHNELIQLSCFYQNNTHGRYQFDHLQKHPSVRETLIDHPPEVRALKSGLSSFEVAVGDWVLQIRVKPMNKFTQASYKVNCSVKKIRTDKKA